MEQLEKNYQKLKANLESDRPRAHSQGDMISVDYFALLKLLRYYEDTKDATRRVLIARDALGGDRMGRDGGAFFGMRLPKPERQNT